MKVKVIDDTGFPEMDVADSHVISFVEGLDTKDLLALYVLVEGTEHRLFEILTHEVYKFAGHEEEDGTE